MIKTMYMRSEVHFSSICISVTSLVACVKCEQSCSEPNGILGFTEISMDMNFVPLLDF